MFVIVAVVPIVIAIVEVDIPRVRRYPMHFEALQASLR